MTPLVSHANLRAYRQLVLRSVDLSDRSHERLMFSPSVWFSESPQIKPDFNAFPELGFKEGEEIENAIPLDIQEVENTTSTITLALKSGSYQIVVQNIDKNGVLFPFVVD